MSTNNDINYEALRKLLIKVKTKINEKIAAIDLNAEQKIILSKADKIVTTGNGLKYLSDNGEYISIDFSNLTDIFTKSKELIDLFQISKQEDNSYTYNLIFPDEVQSKMDIINISGDGTKVLTDSGEYQEYHKEDYYREMTDEEINTLISELATIK